MNRGLLERLNSQGLWAISEIKVRVIDNNLVWIDYHKYVVNAETHRDVVKVGFFEKRKGVTLEEKVQSHLDKLKNRLEKENIQILKRKEFEAKFNNE